MKIGRLLFTLVSLRCALRELYVLAVMKQSLQVGRQPVEGILVPAQPLFGTTTIHESLRHRQQLSILAERGAVVTDQTVIANEMVQPVAKQLLRTFDQSPQRQRVYSSYDGWWKAIMDFPFIRSNAIPRMVSTKRRSDVSESDSDDTLQHLMIEMRIVGEYDLRCKPVDPVRIKGWLTMHRLAELHDPFRK